MTALMMLKSAASVKLMVHNYMCVRFPHALAPNLSKDF